MELPAFQCPYEAGKTLRLQIDQRPSRNVNATITRAFQPFTMSCVMVVHLDWTDLKGHYVLKLYDRRFATQLRQDDKAYPWDLEIENEYHEFIRSGDVSNFFNSCAEKISSEEDWAKIEGKNWSKAQHEAYLQYSCLQFYQTEVEVYNRLHDIQGKDVPRLLARLLMQTSPDSSSASEYLDCPGILLELIEGFPLTDLADHAPRDVWQHVCEEAVQIVSRIGDRDIRNQDVKTRSFIVRRNPGAARFKVFMTDFGSCVFHKQGQDDRDWREWKAIQDEEGAVGLVMERKLKGYFKYHRTPESRKLQDVFKSEE